MYENCLFFNLNSFVRVINKRWEDEFSPLGLSASHGYLLRLILAEPGSTQKRLAEAMDLAPSTVTRFLEVLEQKGFVRRTGCTNDGRAVTVEATKKGQSLAAPLEKASADLTRFLGKRLGAKAAAELIELLKQSHELIRSHEPIK